jgi:tetratricopeptide (TPR) repeat protein
LHDPIGGQLPARVRALSFDVQRATVEGIEAIARARWPALASLTIASMSGIDEWPAPSPLAPLLAGTAAPRLTELRVVEANPSELTDRLAAEILQSALLPRLTALDFAFDRVDIEALRAEYPRFAHVGSLFASAERCTDADTLGSYVWFLDELDPPRAAALAARGVRHADTDFDRHSIGKQHGAALSMIGDHAGAIAALRASLALDNDCGMTWLHMAIAQKRAGNLVEAEAAIALAVAATKHTAERRSLVFHQASIAAARRGVAAVREQLEEARLLFTLDDIDADVLYERACLLALLDDRPAALAALAACLARCPHYRLHAGTELDFASLRDTGELAELLGLSQ